MFYVPSKLRAKADPIWRYGIWLGRAMHADESYVALADGTVTRARAIMRLIEAARWSKEKVLAIKARPSDKFSDGLEKSRRRGIHILAQMKKQKKQWNPPRKPV